MNDLITRRQRQYLLSLPKIVIEGLLKSTEHTTKGYNEEFIQKIKSPEMVEKYPGHNKFVQGFFSNVKIYKQSCQRMREAGDFLRQEENRLPLPSILGVAYYIGMGAGVDDPPPPRKVNNNPRFAQFKPAEPHEWKCAVNMDVFDPLQFYKEKSGKENWKEVHRHTLKVKDALEGRIKESELPDSAAGLPQIELRQFHVLIAMFIGYSFADWKEIQGEKVGYVY